jgi:hypothetical protein
MGSLLLAIACLSAVFAAYRIGFDRGFVTGQLEVENHKSYYMVYNVDDLLENGEDGKPDYDTLIDKLVRVPVDPWESYSGPGPIEVFGPGQLSFSGTAVEQEHFRKILQAMHDRRRKANSASSK